MSRLDRSQTERPCPLCGEPLYPWIALPGRANDASVGMMLSDEPENERVIERCENCGVAIEAKVEVDLAEEWRAIGGDGERVATPNRSSLQAIFGVEGWAALPVLPGGLLLTSNSLALLAERTGMKIGPVRTPLSVEAQGWMWQTLLNGLTFHPNYFREVRAGRLRAANSRSRFGYYADGIVTVLGGALAVLVSVPLELIAVAVKRGGMLEAQVEGRAEGATPKPASRA